MDALEFSNWVGLKDGMEGKAVRLPKGEKKNNGKGRGLTTAATTVDWAASGHMTPVKNQGGCGSCWAFAVTTTLEGTLAIKSGNAPYELSEQQGVDCTLTASRGGQYAVDMFGKDYGCWGCEGCWMSNHFDFLKDWGAMRKSDYEYTASQSGACYHDSSKVVGRVASYTQIISSVEDMKARVRLQPMDVAVRASETAW